MDVDKILPFSSTLGWHSLNVNGEVQKRKGLRWIPRHPETRLHVSQLPPNPAVLAPGPAFIYVVVKGVPSIGAMVMIGNGQLGTQPTANSPSLPGKTPLIVQKTETAAEMGSVAGGKVSAKKNNSPRSASISFSNVAFVGLVTLVNWLH